MYDGSGRRSPARDELCRRLAEGRARAGLDLTQLAHQSNLRRTTVSKALSSSGGVPSADTVAALARALRLSVGELLQLQRKAAEESGAPSAHASGPGRSIGQWEPHELEVHPAGLGKTVSGGGVRTLPGYVPRRHDQALAAAVRDASGGRSKIVFLVGSSSTGKTRACWEAVQPLAVKGWRLWHPFDPTRAQAALEELQQVRPRTVVWLNEAQHYLGDPAVGELVAAAVHRLLSDEQRGPVLVLGTLWPEYAHQYTALPTPGGHDPHSRARELLAGHTLTVPDTFDTSALTAAAALAENGDGLLADALTRTRDHGRVAQDLAGAPELLRRYEQSTPPARALLEAAMDARRLGVRLHLRHAFLTDAAAGYLSEHDYDQLTDHWAEAAYAELAQPVHGKQAPLRRTTPRPPQHPPTPTTSANNAAPPAGPVFRLADYLEQHGRTTRRHLCPPASFWHAAHTHLTHPDDLHKLTEAAEDRHRLQWAHHLRHRAADHGSTQALHTLAVMQEEAGDREGAEALARQAADHGSPRALLRLAGMRERAGDREEAEALARQAADHGSPRALLRLAGMRERAGDREGAEAFARQAADHGDIDALRRLAEMREEAGDREGAEAFARQAADCGSTHALYSLAEMRERAGDREGAEVLVREAADCGSTHALYSLAEMREQAGDREGAEALVREAADHGDTDALLIVAVMQEEAGDREGAEALARQATSHGFTAALTYLAGMREQSGARRDAEALYWEAADCGSTHALYHLARMREETGDRDGAEALVRQAAQHGDTDALRRLAEMRERAGDGEGADVLAREAVGHGDTDVLLRLARMREEAGDREGADVLAREAVGHGDTDVLLRLARMREEAGDREGAEVLVRQAAHHGSTDAIRRLAEMREEAGDREGAEALVRQAADHGDTDALFFMPGTWQLLTRLWPHGLDPDGTPTPPWQ
ncbi:helix-turn-helix domain-containing/SEL1-like repeat protein [Streptomyces cinnabarinus]|uniref:Helix-turn-helix domain-containing/SEL1-like repeat protein n=1 Tax=Streptomyces cinnabarinus TaxID=67287 RepID=A0ABY7KV08_9ACTN|nr:helix-turn-helix domain-containing/SEL1-like repeat protein [Streptomyces cinnabarinus]WAZ26704.1 helix-turn-helix domain-containing/SEL1-like repeat protein [Streptomyces cinnabarinus]